MELTDLIYTCTKSFTVGAYSFEAGKVYGYTKEELAQIPQEDLMVIYQNIVSGEYGTVTTPDYIKKTYPDGALVNSTVNVAMITEGESVVDIQNATVPELTAIMQAEYDGLLTLANLQKSKVFVLKPFTLRNVIFNLYQVRTLLCTSDEFQNLISQNAIEIADEYSFGKLYVALVSFADPVTGLSLYQGEIINGYTSMAYAQKTAFEKMIRDGVIKEYVDPIFGAKARTVSVNVTKGTAKVSLLDLSTDVLSESYVSSGTSSVIYVPYSSGKVVFTALIQNSRNITVSQKSGIELLGYVEKAGTTEKIAVFSVDPEGEASITFSVS